MQEDVCNLETMMGSGEKEFREQGDEHSGREKEQSFEFCRNDTHNGPHCQRQLEEKSYTNSMAYI
jgi:hypothetical protein